ncbi:MAG TPA: arsenate reductase ArsC [Cyclobacteriaceae bacterium]
MKKILILCTGNSCRSQMAEGYFRKFAGNNAKIVSAGIEAHGLNKNAVKVMNEDEVDISTHTSKTIDDLEESKFDFVITVCDNARESCPVFPSEVKTIHQNFEDPAAFKGDEKNVLQKFREVRDQIKSFALKFVHLNLH